MRRLYRPAGDALQPPGLIQDTVWVRVNTRGVIRTKFKQFTGKSVLHCHILPHEDTGMMQNFLIQDARDPSHR
jgi:suppressor of ftsI